MLVRTMSVPEFRMLHQSCDSLPQIWTRVLGHSVFKCLSEVESPVSWWGGHGKVVSILKHWRSDISVEIVDSSARSDNKVTFFAQWSEDGPNSDMEMWIVSRIL